MPCVAGLFVLAQPIIKHLFEYGAWTAASTNAVAIAIMIQVFVLPAMLVSQIYSKTLYASQDVKTPVKTSMISLGAAAAIYLGAFWFIGYLAIPVGVVVSGYLKNYLLGRACRKRGLAKIYAGTIRAIGAFAILSAIMGVALWFIPINSIWMLFAAIAGFAAIYLPAAYALNRIIPVK